MVNWARHAIAFTVALLIFLLGLFAGIAMDYARRSWAREEIERSFVDTESLQLQTLLLSQGGGCEISKVALEDAISDLGANLEKIKRYEKEGRIELDPNSVIWRRYMIANIKYWLLANNYRELCNDTNLVTVLYFYSYSSCDICPKQGTLLSYFKKKYGERLLVFPLNMDVKEPALKMLAMRYNVTVYPTLVIDNKVYRGFVNKTVLEGILCEKLGC